jgi:hypothetical protein
MNSARRRKGPATDIEAALSGLLGMRVGGLRQTWREWFDNDPPRCQSADLLRRLIAWRLQELRFGGLPADIRRRLRQWRESAARRDGALRVPTFKPGSMITRTWRGALHRVHVLDDGFSYEGRRYGSLSKIARLITGKRWSGPRFFGLEVNGDPASNQPAMQGGR